MSVDIHDVITCATFCDDRLRGSGVARGLISRFPIDLRRRPYNTLALACECVSTQSPVNAHMQCLYHKSKPKVFSYKFENYSRISVTFELFPSHLARSYSIEC